MMTNLESQMAMLRRMTTTLGISAMCTFIFYVMPTMLKSAGIYKWSTTTIGQVR